MVVAICSNNIEDRTTLKNLLVQYEKENNIPLEILEYDSQMILYGICEIRHEIDVVIVDFCVNGENGIDILKNISLCGYQGTKIYFSESKRENIEAIDIDGVLTRPLSYDGIKKVLNGYNYLNNKRNKYIYNSKKNGLAIYVCDIYLVEKNNTSLNIFTHNNEWLNYRNDEEILEEILASGYFCQIGNKFYVNIEAVDKITNTELILKNGFSLQIPTKEYERIRNELSEYIRKYIRKS